MQELAHSIDALPCATSTTWTPLFEGVIDVTPLLADVQHVVALANDVKVTWERWSSAFGCLGTAMVALSATLSGGAVLSDDYGVKCERAQSQGAVDTPALLTSETNAVHQIYIKRRNSRAEAKPLEVEPEAVAAADEARPRPSERSFVSKLFEQDYAKCDAQKVGELARFVADSPTPKAAQVNVQRMYTDFSNAKMSWTSPAKRV